LASEPTTPEDIREELAAAPTFEVDEDDDDDDDDDEHYPELSVRMSARVEPEEPEVEQDLPARATVSAAIPDAERASQCEELMNRGAPFSPEEMETLHDFVTEVRGPAYWDTFRNRPDVSVLRHAEGALRHFQTVLSRKRS